jgi:tRNA(adenine34) deaminase
MESVMIKKNRDHAYWMGKALEQAARAEARGEVPIGAVVVHEGRIIARGYNTRETAQDPAGHAELLAIRKAARVLQRWRLTDVTLYVTLEPCLMCTGAIILARIPTVVYGCRDPKAGALGSQYDLSNEDALNHRFQVIAGVEEDRCSAVLSRFFKKLRDARASR